MPVALGESISLLTCRERFPLLRSHANSKNMPKIKDVDLSTRSLHTIGRFGPTARPPGLS